MTDINEETKADFGSEFGRDFFADDRPALQVKIAAATHVGLVRERNEDHYAVLRRTRGCEMLLTNLVKHHEFADDHAYVVLVADGIGGSQFGDLASELAIETLINAARQATSWVMKFKDLDAQDCRERANAYVDQIQDAFRQQGLVDPQKSQMGTTLTCAYLVPPHAIFSQIGDSRAYLFRDGILTQLTRDQTLSQVFIDAGVEQEKVQGFGNVLMNSLGGRRDQVDVEMLHLELVAGDQLLLCSDGLTDLVAEEAIAGILSRCQQQSACDKLVQSALDAGGNDNITVVVCELSDPE